MTDISRRVCQAATLVEAGYPIAEGGYTDLPNPVVEALGIVTTERARWIDERLSRAKGGR